MRLFIDPGHGGKDPGAVSRGVREADVVLGIGRELAQVMVLAGWNVGMSRRTDIFLSLAQRAVLANTAAPDLFLSIHANAAGNRKAAGSEAWVRAGDFAARDVAAALAPWAEAAVYDPWRGIKTGTFYVLRHVHCPAVLLEVEFLTGPGEAERLSVQLEQERIAHYIGFGLLVWSAPRKGGA